MPSLDLSDLNIVLSILGIYIVIYGFFSVKLKQEWHLGEALPAMLMGIILGPVAAKFLEVDRWGSAAADQQNTITLGVTRVVIGVQLVMAGYQLPAKYAATQWKELSILLIPTMAVMWLCTTLCILATIPKVTLLAALAIGACVSSIDPVLSQAIVKGPFADNYVARPLREIISAEAGANDGFGYPFLMLAIYLMRDSELPEGSQVQQHPQDELSRFNTREADVGRQGGGVLPALRDWCLDTWLYTFLLSAVFGAIIGWCGGKAMQFCLHRRWVASDSYLLFPTALGLCLIGVCGVAGMDDFLACFIAGVGLNWDGQYLAETERRRDEVNSCLDLLLNFGGFMYVGAVIPWEEFHQPELTGITLPRLIGLGFLVLVFRRIPAILLGYKLVPKVVTNVKEALFMGYFGPIGIGAVFYVEHARVQLLPPLGEGDAGETDLTRAIGTVTYWLVFFSIVVHGLSIPALNIIYHYAGVPTITDDAVRMKRKTIYSALPANAIKTDSETVIAYNRFSRPNVSPADQSLLHGAARSGQCSPIQSDDEDWHMEAINSDVENQHGQMHHRHPGFDKRDSL
ncbi:Sodium/hydrogen exchanger family protein [Xylariaceae sp. FL0662B]|nr:Sodium/hydrogen exchanger family protein [Xylariaceae sp. FL0662B]